MRDKKYKIFLLLGIISIIAMLGVSVAYLYQEIALPNAFQTMTYDVSLREEFNGTWGTKKVYIENNDEKNSPVVLRVNYNEIWSKNDDGLLLTLSNTLNGENVVTKNFTNAFTNDFVLKDDGWYYYKKVLNANSSVQILESIALRDSLIANNSEYGEYNYELIFNYEAIQATSNAVESIWNKDVSIEGNNVSWS